MCFRGSAMGEVKHPSYVETRWEKWMDAAVQPSGAQPTDTVVGLLNTLTALNPDPYAGNAYTNPSTKLGDVQGRWDQIKPLVDFWVQDPQLEEPGFLRWEKDWEGLRQKLTAIGWQLPRLVFDGPAILTESRQAMTDTIAAMENPLPEHWTGAINALSTDKWAEILAAAKEAADVMGLLQAVVASTEAMDHADKAKEALTTAANNVVTTIVPTTDWNAFVLQAETTWTAGGPFIDPVDFTAVLAAAAANATAIENAAETAADDYGVPSTNWAALITAAVTKVDDPAGNVLKNIDLDALITAAKEGSTTEITAAVAAAVAAVDDAVVAQLISRYSTSIVPELAKAKRRFAGGMIDLNAVNSSAFLFGLATLETERLSEVDRFAAGAITATYQEGFRGHVDAYKHLVTQRIVAEIQKKAAREQFLLDASDKGTRLHLGNIEYRLGQIQLYGILYNTLVEAGVEAEKANQVAKLSFLQEALRSMITLREAMSRLYSAQLNLFGDAYRVDHATKMQARVENKQARDRYILQGADQTVRLLDDIAQIRMAYIDLFLRTFSLHITKGMDVGRINKAGDDEVFMRAAELIRSHHQLFFSTLFDSFNTRHAYKRDDILLTREYEVGKTEHAVKSAYWDLDAMLQASEMFGALAGGSHMVQKGPSGFEKGLSAVLAVAQTVSSVAKAGVTT